jgi:putative salt-induced outer membrane protein
MILRRISLVTLLLAAPLAAQEPPVAAPALPEAVRALIEAAIATGDEAKVRTVIDLAKATNPAAAGEIDALQARFAAAREEQRRIAEEQRLAAVRNAGALENWTGRGEIGGFRATGNGADTGLSGRLDLKRQGIAWTHQLRASADYQRSGGVTSREKYLVSYEPRYQVGADLFTYGLGQFESDRFQGFAARYALSAGAGYQAVKRPDLNLAVKAGPALRHTRFTNGESDTRLAGLVGVDFDWTIVDGLKLTQDTNLVAETGGTSTVIFDSRNTTLALVTGLEARLTGKLSTRLSYSLDYQSDPQPGKVATDTLSRITFVYGF